MTTSPKVIFRGGIRRRLSNRLTRDLSHLTLFSYLELGNDLAYKSGYLNFSNGTDQEKDLKKAKAQARPVGVKRAPTKKRNSYE
jgi:hemolysin activation/secretion protein